VTVSVVRCNVGERMECIVGGLDEPPLGAHKRFVPIRTGI
jgi:hypothetical protein